LESICPICLLGVDMIIMLVMYPKAYI
jgi:hypothetical protein